MNKNDPTWPEVAFLFFVALVVLVAVTLIANHGRKECEAKGGEYKYNMVRKIYKCEEG